VAAVMLTGELLVIVALSFALGSSLSRRRCRRRWRADRGLTIGDSMFWKLAILMILAIIAGMFLDPLIPVLVPVILPTLIMYDINLIHFGVLMVMAVVIGQLTPPLAIALIITGRIAQTDQLRSSWPTCRSFADPDAITVMLMLFPQLATWLPSLIR
jgi:TRAP-type C4-dicarboxylate transport system permease large subunit